MKVKVTFPTHSIGYTTHLSNYNDIIKEVQARMKISKILNKSIVERPEYVLCNLEIEVIEKKENKEEIARQINEIISVLKNTKYFKTIVSAATYYARHSDELEFRQLLWKILQSNTPLLEQTIKMNVDVYIYE